MRLQGNYVATQKNDGRSYVRGQVFEVHGSDRVRCTHGMAMNVGGNSSVCQDWFN